MRGCRLVAHASATEHLISGKYRRIPWRSKTVSTWDAPAMFSLTRTRLFTNRCYRARSRCLLLKFAGCPCRREKLELWSVPVIDHKLIWSVVFGSYSVRCATWTVPKKTFHKQAHTHTCQDTHTHMHTNKTQTQTHPHTRTRTHTHHAHM